MDAVYRLHSLAQHLLNSSTQISVSSVIPSAQYSSAKISVEPRVALYDEKVKILLHGFPSKENVTLHGQVVQGQKKIIFASCAHYVTDNAGFLDISEQPSLGGTYTGVEPMGIVWSLKPAPGQPSQTRMAINFTDKPCIISLQTYLGHLNLTDLYGDSASDQQSIASTDIERWFRHEDVTRIEVEEGGVRGALYLPPGDGPFQGVIDMFGSAGGIIEYRSALLASRGFLALSLPYFNYKDLPDNFMNLDYAYFEEAVNWLSSHPKVCKKGVGVVAVSKGTENAYCMGAYSSKVSAVVAINGFTFMTYGDMKYKGEILLPTALPDFDHWESTDEGFDFRFCMPEPSPVIPIWKGKAKYLIFQSLDDYQVRHDCVEILLEACPEEKKQDIEVVKYPGAGHLLEPPYNALCRTSINRGVGMVMKWGGNPKDHAHAQEDSWKRILEFLRTNIPQS